MRRKILLAVAVPVGVFLAGKLAEQLSSRGHEKAGSRLRRAADVVGGRRG